jgi:nitroimidazol reductase NimA-like FMN-containing flavoprotein (pyridoxamine 5'-phosphate oxidase superfamily)
MKTFFMFGELNQIEIEEVLHREVVGRIGCHSDGVTYIVPISYAYDGENIFAHTHEGMKINMMRKNPDICFEVDSMQDMANWQSVICWGKFEELVKPGKRSDALEQLHQRILPNVASATVKLSSEWPFSPKDYNTIKGIVFRIQLINKTGKFENNSVPSFLAWG